MYRGFLCLYTRRGFFFSGKVVQEVWREIFRVCMHVCVKVVYVGCLQRSLSLNFSVLCIIKGVCIYYIYERKGREILR